METPFGNIASPNITPDTRDRHRRVDRRAIRNAPCAKASRPAARGFIRRCPIRPIPRCRATTSTRSGPISRRCRRCAIRSKPTPCRFPSTSAPRCAGWDCALFQPARIQARSASKSADWNRGAYLVAGPGHCGACHTPKSFLGGDKTGEYLRGSHAAGLVRARTSPMTTRAGIGGWSTDDIVTYLKTGHNRITAATGPMAEEIEHSTSKMTDERLKAIAAYLKSLPGVRRTVPAVESRRSGDGRRAGDLPRSMRGLPSDRRQGRAAVIPIARGIVGRALARPDAR